MTLEGVVGRAVVVPPHVDVPSLAVATPPTTSVAALPDRRFVVSPPAFQRRYAAVVAAADVAAVVASLVAYRWWGAEPPPWPHARIIPGAGFLLGAAVVLAACRAWDSRVLGQGTEEFNRLLRGFCWLGVLIAVAGLAFKTASLRPYAFGVAPSAFGLALVVRWGLRKRLHFLRRRGRCMRDVLAVGSPQAVSDLIVRTRRAPHTGWRVIAACVPDGHRSGLERLHDVPIVGDTDSVVSSVRRFGCHVVAISPTPGSSPQRLHTLAWDLEGSGVTVVVDPGLMEIAGPRVRIDTLDGVPMLRLGEPTFSGAARMFKNASDFLGAALLLALAAPVLALIAVAIKCGGGPVFYRQERVGRHESTFTMLKFRTMNVGADRMLDELREHDQGAGPLFKMADDPRTTRVGRILRRYSLDELPQLFNVLGGSMSLVGPRPPLPVEVAEYDREARRRLLVKPGMTGLWQVSGRSDLSWEESVRLDRRYVENWTLLLDASIVWKTIGTVVRGSGAY